MCVSSVNWFAQTEPVSTVVALYGSLSLAEVEYFLQSPSLCAPGSGLPPGEIYLRFERQKGGSSHALKVSVGLPCSSWISSLTFLCPGLPGRQVWAHSSGWISSFSSSESWARQRGRTPASFSGSCFSEDGGDEWQKGVLICLFFFLLHIQLFFLTTGSAELQQLISVLPPGFCHLLCSSLNCIINPLFHTTNSGPAYFFNFHWHRHFVSGVWKSNVLVAM